MGWKLWAAAPVIVSVLAVTAIPTPSEALGRRLRTDYKPGEVVTARSLYGNGSIRSVVRPARFGWQVRIPRRGNWVDCRRSCEETLRVKTIDFYGDGTSTLANGADGSFTRECGVFGCLHWEWSY